ncbi:MAG: tetratricopeptide repeat protein [Anaerolineae bacterium]|nr:tetratricopeptide repeat protein [Anaerolineae bacterium]
MSQNSNDILIGRAWASHRAGRNGDAIRDFEQAIKADSRNVDAYYGLGLAHRATEQYPAAETAFTKALELSQHRLEEIRGNRRENNVESSDDDRYMMLNRMLAQRLEELKLKSN